MKIAIITREEDASPKILAQSLSHMLLKRNVRTSIFYNPGFLMRKVPLFGTPKQNGKLHFTLRRHFKNFFQDFLFLRQLKEYDAIVISDCEPNGFWNDHYGIEQLRKRLKLPIIFHEVYYLGNVPSHLEKLKTAGHPTIERYDWHLAVTNVTEIKTIPAPPWSCIGLNLEDCGLNFQEKTDFFVIVDFEQKGYERYRHEQIEALQNLGIPYVSFERRMPMNKIRNYYKKAALIFLQFPETFGVPIAECLTCGTAVFTPSSAWPMSWRLDKHPIPNEPGILPDCFYVYSKKQDLKQKLKEFQLSWDSVKTSKKIHDSFIKNYPNFYFGNLDAIDEFISRVKHNNYYK